MAMMRKSLSFPSNSNISTAVHPALSQSHHILSTAISSSYTPSPSLLSLGKTLTNLRNLHSTVHHLLLLPCIQAIILNHAADNSFDLHVLDGYIRLLDACTITKDMVLQTKHDLHLLLSGLRRKDDISYHKSRRNSKKMLQKSLKHLKSLKSENLSSNKSALVCMLKELEAFTVCTLEALVSHLMGTKGHSGWGLVSKLMAASSNKWNELDKVEEEEDDAVKEAAVKEMDGRIQLVEEELDLLFRQMIKTRAFLLNIISHFF